MDPSDFPAPQPTPIEKFSPSLANQLLACGLRVAFIRDPSYRPLRRPSTYSVLGEVAHAITELAYKGGGFDGDEPAARAWLELEWEKESERQSAKLCAAWAPGSPPSAVEWPGYNLTRARTVRRGARLLASRQRVREATEPAPGTGVELDLDDPASGLYGRADRIERSGNRTRIVDLKSGLHQAEPTADQHRQLLLYAVLLQRSTGDWPSEIAIEDASGAQVAIELDPSAAETALAEVLAAVSAFNEDFGTVDFSTKADPNPDRCRWCAFRVACGPYWQELRTNWEHRSVFGEIEEVGRSDSGGFARVLVASPVDLVGRSVHVSSIAENLSPEATHLAMVDVSGSVASEHVRARWSSLWRAW
jgi:RecB family exonuclease